MACISSTVDNLVDLDNGSSKARDETVGKGKETLGAQCSFNDSVLQNADLSLLEILQSLQSKSGSVSEAPNAPMTCTSTAGLINTPTSTTTVEDNIRNIEQNISVTQEEIITRTDNNGCLQGYFCSVVVFNLNHELLTHLEISVLGKGLGFSPTPTFTNEADLRRDFVDFPRKLRCEWCFRNEPREDFCETPTFRIKSNWSPPKGHPAPEMFLSRMEGETFSLLPSNSTSYNLTKEEWKVMTGLAEDRSIAIKPADKGSCVVVWDKLDYLAKAENYLKDNNTYQTVKFGDDELVKLMEKYNQIFKQFLSKQNISSSEFKYFSYDYKKSTNLGKMYLLPKIHK